jgi:hypothetical protein
MHFSIIFGQLPQNYLIYTADVLSTDEDVRERVDPGQSHQVHLELLLPRFQSDHLDGQKISNSVFDGKGFNYLKI